MPSLFFKYTQQLSVFKKSKIQGFRVNTPTNSNEVETPSGIKRYLLIASCSFWEIFGFKDCSDDVSIVSLILPLLTRKCAK
jgi:hypothetical protein